MIAALLTLLTLLSVSSRSVQGAADGATPAALTSSPDVTTNFWFPDHPPIKIKQFPAGQPVTVVLGLHNGGSEDLNVTGIAGAVTHPAYNQQLIHNFTYQPYNVPVQSGGEVSFEYTFRPDKSLPAREFNTPLMVFYHSASSAFATTFFNDTIDIVEVPRIIDTEMIFLYALLAGALSAAAYFAYISLAKQPFMRNITGGSKPRKVVKKVEKPPPGAAGDQSEWLRGTYYKAPGATVRKSSSRKAVAAVS